MRDDMLDRSRFDRSQNDPRLASPATPRLIFGLILIVVGVVFTLDQLDIIDDAWVVLRFWPLLLVAAGVSKILWPGSSSSRFTGLLLLGIGAWLLLEQFDHIHLSFWNYWPLLLIFFGARVVFQGLSGQRRQVEVGETRTINAVAFLGGSTRTTNTQEFLGGDMMAVLGAVEVDLRPASIAPGRPAVIDAFAFWGGVEITVPDDWTVRVQGIPILGGYEDNTRPPAPGLEGPPQELIVKGFAIMGGVEIKNS